MAVSATDEGLEFGTRVARKGPMVSRRAKVGGALFLIGSAQFVIAMGITQLHYPGYSLAANAISDLGSANSPLAWLFNGSVRVLGILGIAAALLLFSAFRPRLTSRLGLVMLMIGSVGAFAVGTFPEQSPELGGQVHSIASLVAFLFSGIGLVLLGLAMLRDTRWDGYRLYSLVSGGVTIVALALYAGGLYPSGWAGALERLTVAPVLLWAIVIGVHLLRMNTYAPPSGSTSPSPSGTD